MIPLVVKSNGNIVIGSSSVFIIDIEHAFGTTFAYLIHKAPVHVHWNSVPHRSFPDGYFLGEMHQISDATRTFLNNLHYNNMHDKQTKQKRNKIYN